MLRFATKAGPSLFVLLATIALLFSTESLKAQLAYSQNFNANNGSFTGFTRFTGVTACGGSGGAMRFNLYASAPTANLISPSIGTSNGALATITYDYKANNWSANNVGSATPWGSFLVQWGPSATGPWTTIATVANEAQTSACISKSHTFTPSAGAVFIRFSCTWTAGDYFLNFDNIAVNQGSCSGTPAAGTASGPASACSGASISLSATGLTAGVGISYQWERSTDGGTSWSNVPSGTASSVSTSQTVATIYRIRTTCSSGGGTNTSNNVSVSMLTSPCQCLTYNTSGIPGSAFDSEISNVTVGTLNNSSNCATVAPGPGSVLNRYSNYAGAVAGPSVQQGNSVSFSLTQTTCGGSYPNIFQIYVDWNQDGDWLDLGEQVYTQPSTVVGNQTVTGSFTVPVSATAGVTRMRVCAVEDGVSTVNYAHTSFSWGETEDYCFTVTVPPPCTGTPTAGTATGPTISCPGASITLSATGLTTGAGIGYQWESSTDGGTTWTNVSGGAGSSVTVTPSVATLYRIRTNCSTPPGFTNVSNTVSVAMSPSTNCYWQSCPSVPTFAGDGEILNVTVGALNNTSNCATIAPGQGSIQNRYSNFSNLAATNLNILQNYPLSVNVGTCLGNYNYFVKVYIDLNQDGDFNDADEEVYASAVNQLTTSTFTGNFIIPCTALTGPTGMRVIAWESGAPNPITPCVVGGAYGYGETEDYVVNIQPAASTCSGIPAASNATASVATACPSTNIDLDLTPAYTGCGLSYQWQRSVDGGVTWLNVGTAQLTAPLTVTGQLVATQYRCEITCTITSDVTNSAPVTVNQSPLLSCYCPSSATSTIDEEIVRVNVGTINQVSTCATTAPGAGSVQNLYSNYTAVSTNLVKTQVNAMTVALTACPNNPSNTTTWTDWLGVWIDYNRDGVLQDPAERAHLGQYTVGYFGSADANFTFAVPGSAVDGPALMRVIMTFSTPPTPCGTYTFGETEDYQVNIVTPPACSGIPTPGTIPSSLEILTNTSTTITPVGLGVSANLAYQWEESPDNFTWVPAVGGVGATTNQYTTPNLTTTTWYRLRVECTTTSDVAYTNSMQVITVGGATCGAPYVVSSLPFTGNFSSAGAGDDLGTQTSTCGGTYGGGQDVVFQFNAPIAGNYEISVVNTSGTRLIGWFLKNSLNCTNLASSLGCAVSTNLYNSAHNVVNIATPGTYFVVVDYAFPVTQSNFLIRIRQVPTPVPTNDECAGATLLTQAPGACSVSSSGSLAGATASGLPVVCAGGVADDDIWFRFVATQEGAQIDVGSPNSGVGESGANIAFEVYSGAACASLTSIGCVNNTNSRGVQESGIITGLTIGDTYYIRVYDRDAGYGSALGSISICVSTPPPPVNNDCAGAINLAVGATCVNTAGNTILATQSQAAISCNGFTGNADDDVWYAFTLPTAQFVNIQVTPVSNTFDPVMQLFSGNNCGSLSPEFCADFALRGGAEEIRRTLPAGDYRIRVYHYGAGTGGGGTHNICISSPAIQPAPRPVNDNTCAAINLSVNTDCISEGPFSSQTASRTLVWPAVENPAAGTPNDDVWFRITVPPGVTSLELSVQGGSGYDPAFQVYNMSNCKTITAVFPAVDATVANEIETQIIYGLTPGATLYLRVWDWFATSPTGVFTVCARNVPRPPNDVISSATPLFQLNSATCAPGNETFGYTIEGTFGDASAPSCGGNPDDNVWYTFVATNTTATITVVGTQGFDPVVDLRFGAGAGTSVTCSNASGANGTEVINATGLTIGATYKIQVYGVGANPTGWGTFTICVNGIAAPPPNDNCAGAFALPNTSPCTPIAGLLTGATLSSATVCGGTNDDDIWYRFIASSPVATITTVNAGASDMVVEMFSGACGTLTSIGCADSDPAPGTENLVVTGLTPGQTYYVRTWSFLSTAPGTSSTAPNPTISVCYTGVPPANDNICGAQNVNVSSSLVNVNSSNLGATSQSVIPAAPFADWNNDVWYRSTVPANGVIAICVTGVGVQDTRIRVYSSSDNTCNGTLTLLGGDDNSGPGVTSLGSFIYLSGLTPGNTVFYAVDFPANNLFGSFRLNVNDGWLWTGTGGFAHNGAGVWINQATGETAPSPFVNNTISGASGSWSTLPESTVINIPVVGPSPIVSSNATIGGVRFIGGVFSQAKITVNAGSILTLNGATFAGSGRGINGSAAGGRFEGAGRLDIGAGVAGQTVTVNYPTRFRLATTVLGTANVQSNGNMIFDNGASLYSGQAAPNSQVTGNITYRRQGNTSQLVYNFWSSPITNGVLASLSAPALNPNLYQYNTANATGLDYLGTQAGWDPLTPAASMTPGRGYIATGAGLANFTGLPQQNTVTLAGQTGSGGNNFNLLGNPYPAPISAAQFLTANASRLSTASIYIWDDDASGGTTYAAGDFIVYNGIGTINGPNSGNPFSGNIGACQGYFVNYSGTGSFTFDNTMKVYGTNSEFFDASAITRMRLRMENADQQGSETILAFIDDATESVDPAYDALRLIGNADMSLYTFIGNSEYVIQAWPSLTQERVIDLGAINTMAGPSTITINMFENFDPTVVVYLEDTELNVFHNLTANSTYAFNNTGLDGETVRFRLHFRAPIAVASSMDCSGTESGKIIIANPNSTPVALEVKNANNEVVATAAPFVGEHEVSNLAAGNYELNMVYNGGGSITRNAVVETNGMTAPASFIASATNVSIADAIIEFQGTAQGASEYIWDFGDGTIVTGDLNPVHAYTELGVYTVTFTALNNGCGSSATTTVSVTANTTGIGSTAVSNGFSIFPNPASNVANLLLNLDRSESDLTISIHDAAGRLVSTKLVNEVRSGAVVGLDIDNLSNGIYQVTVEGKNFRNVGRLTIAK